MRQEEAGFGLRQRSSSTTDIRRYGANAAYKFQEFEDEKTGRRAARAMYRLVCTAKTIWAQAAAAPCRKLPWVKRVNALALLPVCAKSKTTLSAVKTASLYWRWLAWRYTIPKYGVTFQASREQPLGGKDSVDDFPARTRLSVDKTITDKASVRVTHDILDGAHHRRPKHIHRY